MKLKICIVEFQKIHLRLEEHFYELENNLSMLVKNFCKLCLGCFASTLRFSEHYKNHVLVLDRYFSFFTHKSGLSS